MENSIKGLKIGFVMTGSFCTIEATYPAIKDLVGRGGDIIPIISPAVDEFNTRFQSAESIKVKLQEITGNRIITTITEAEPIGPKDLLDALVVAPCTGNTLAKIAHGITDTSATMAIKAILRNGHPVVIAISTNDALSANACNIGTMMNVKNIYFVPFYQDDCIKKPTSLVADNDLIFETLMSALQGKQIQPIIKVKN